MSRMASLRAATVMAAVLLVAHATAQGVAAATFWRPCEKLGATSDACSYLQYEAPVPWWSHLAWLWPVEVAVLIALLAVALRGNAHRTEAARAAGSYVGAVGVNESLIAIALLLVTTCNTVTDYVVTPAFNGGITSADSPPGHGVFGSVGIALAGLALILSLVPFQRLLGDMRGRGRGEGQDPGYGNLRQSH